MEPTEPRDITIHVILLAAILLVGGAGYKNYVVRQENTALKQEIATLANMKSPVNCPSYDWFTGKGH